MTEPLPSRQKRYAQMREYTAHISAARMKYQSFTVPPDVLEERIRALSAPQTVTAVLLGDPRPGRSALDKRRMGQ